MEPRPLSDKSLKYVLKHLDFNSRIHLSRQSPSLRKSLKLSPGYINRLEFDVKSLKINKTIYHWHFNSEETNCNTTFLSLDRDYYEKLTAGRNFYGFLEYLFEKILEGEAVLKVGTLIFGDTEYLKIPENLKLHVRHVNVSKGEAAKVLQKFAGIFQNSSLKSLEIIDTQSFEHPMIKSAETLILNTKRDLRELEHQKIHAKFQFDSEYLLDLVKHWLGAESGKEAGARYTFETKNEEEARNLINAVKQKYEKVYYSMPSWLIYKTSFEFAMQNFSSLRINYYNVDGIFILNMRIVESF